VRVGCHTCAYGVGGRTKAGQYTDSAGIEHGLLHDVRVIQASGALLLGIVGVAMARIGSPLPRKG